MAKGKGLWLVKIKISRIHHWVENRNIFFVLFYLFYEVKNHLNIFTRKWWRQAPYQSCSLYKYKYVGCKFVDFLNNNYFLNLISCVLDCCSATSILQGHAHDIALLAMHAMMNTSHRLNPLSEMQYGFTLMKNKGVLWLSLAFLGGEGG